MIDSKWLDELKKRWHPSHPFVAKEMRNDINRLIRVADAAKKFVDSYPGDIVALGPEARLLLKVLSD